MLVLSGPGAVRYRGRKKSQLGSQRWRIILSVFLAGLYAPFAGSYLASVTEWNLGLSRRGSPPATAASRGAFVLLMFFGVPLFAAITLGFLLASEAVYQWLDRATGSPRWWGLTRAHTMAWLSLFVSWFYGFSAVRSWLVERRFAAMLTAGVGADARALYEFERGAVGRALLRVACWIPFAGMVAICAVIVRHEWTSWLHVAVEAYLVALIVACWLSSWLNIAPAHRFSRTARPAP